MELFEQIRREYEHGVGTIRAVAKKLGVHRRMVREALADALPPERKKGLRPEPKLGPLKIFIDGILEADRRAPRKQRHTAHRIYVRIRQEIAMPQIAESTVRRYVVRRNAQWEECRRYLSRKSNSYGAEAQVDWFEAYANFMGDRQKSICLLHA